MAIFHLSAQVISRGKGRSVVAAAAYRSGTRLEDERQGLTHDYGRRHGVRTAFIMTPESAPDWMRDRQTLWTAVDAAEKRKDAQTAREINIALPRELTPEQQRAVVQEFVQAAFVGRGMVADVAIHEGHNDQEPNPHVHILLTTRTIAPDGFGAKNRDWNAKKLLVDWRAQWETACNAALDKAGQSVQIDARSLANQGIADRLPTVHEGSAVRQMEQRGAQTDRGSQNRTIRAQQALVVELAEARTARQALEVAGRQIDRAEAWRAQTDWSEADRQALRLREEQAERVLTRRDMEQALQNAQTILKTTTETQRVAETQWHAAQHVVAELQHKQQQQAQRAQEAQNLLHRDFGGIHGVWAKWRKKARYQALQNTVRDGEEAWQGSAIGPVQAQVDQCQTVYAQATKAKQDAEGKVQHITSMLQRDWTAEEQQIRYRTARREALQAIQNEPLLQQASRRYQKNSTAEYRRQAQVLVQRYPNPDWAKLDAVIAKAMVASGEYNVGAVKHAIEVGTPNIPWSAKDYALQTADQAWGDQETQVQRKAAQKAAGQQEEWEL
jgi:hypothetical protein